MKHEVKEENRLPKYETQGDAYNEIFQFYLLQSSNFGNNSLLSFKTVKWRYEKNLLKNVKYRISLEPYNGRTYLEEKIKINNEVRWFRVPFEKDINALLKLAHSNQSERANFEDTDIGMHNSEENTLSALRSMGFYWKGFKSCIKEFKDKCARCSQIIPKTKHTSIRPIISNRPLERFQMDLLSLEESLQKFSKYL